MARTRLYRDGTLVLEDFPVQDISDHVGDKACTVWLDLCDTTSADFAMITNAPSWTATAPISSSAPTPSAPTPRGC